MNPSSPLSLSDRLMLIACGVGIVYSLWALTLMYRSITL